MSECPELDAFATPTSAVDAHLLGCPACRIVADLVALRRDTTEARDERANCERYEDLMAARATGPVSETAIGLIDAHAATCAACRAVANTMAPVTDLHGDHTSLPAVSTAAYALGREVARGGMGRIVAARDLRIGRDVAVKELLAGGAAFASRFEREARITARLQHPGIVPIYEIGTWPDGTPFYAMRMVEGQTLGAAIAATTSLAERLALLPSVIAAAEAVAFAHAHSVIHRDLTPSNVMVGEFGETVVIDWGLAKDLSGEVADDAVLEAGPFRASASGEGLTAIGAVIGTAAYMSPEQAHGETVDRRSDVYALGALLYQLLVGTAPYRGKSLEIVELVKDGPPTAIDKVVPDAPRDLISIAQKAMARGPAWRYQDARELADELVRFQAGRIVEAHRYSRGELLRRWIRRHRAAVIGVSAALVALVVAGSIGLTSVLRERDRADDEASEAIAARSVADAQKAKANGIAVSLLEEQGRQELLNGDHGKALAYLNAALQQGLDTPALRLMLGSALRDTEARKRTYECDGLINSIAQTPDGARAVATCGDITRVWSLDDSRPPLTLPTKRAFVAQFSHDGRFLVTAGEHVEVWDATNGELRSLLAGDLGADSFVAFTADSRRIVTVDIDGAARVWDATSGAVIRSLRPGTRASDVHARLSANGHILYVAAFSGRAELWNVDTGALVHGFDHGAPIYRMDLSADGRLAASCGLNGAARIWDTATGGQLLAITAHTNAVTCRFSPDGNSIVLGSADGTADVWSVRTGTKLASLSSDGYVDDAVFSADGRRLVAAGLQTVMVFSVDTGARLETLAVETRHVMLSSGSSMLLAAVGHQLEAWDARGTILRLSFAPPPGESLIQISHDATRLLTRRQDGTLTLWDTATRQRVTHVPIRLLVPIDPIVDDYPVWMSGDGARLVAPTSASELVVIETQSGATIAKIAIAGPPKTLALDWRGQRVLVVDRGEPAIFDVDSGRRLFVLDGRVDAAALSADGQRVLAWADPHSVEVWDIDARRILSTLHVITPTSGLALDRSGHRVVLFEQVGDFSVGRLGLWNADTGARLLSMATSSASFDPTGTLLATYGRGRLEVWRAADGVRLSSAQIQGPDDGTSNLTPMVTADGQFAVASSKFAAVDIRSATDGRVLAALGTTSWAFELVPSGGAATVGLPPTWLSEGRAAVSAGARIAVWDLALESRSAQEIDRIVKTQVPWRERNGALIAVSAQLFGRVTRRGVAAAGVEVTAKLQPNGNPFSTHTEPDGRYLLEGLRAGVYKVTVAGASSLPRTANVTSDAPATLDLEIP